MDNGCPHARGLLERGIGEGLHPGAQLYVWHGGKVVADFAVGESRPDVPMMPDTVNLWYSSVKPVAAVAVAQLWERGLFDLDDRVAKYIPEFAMRGKDAITIRHVLTHTGGFRAVPGLEWNDGFEDAIAKICEAPLEPRWIVGRTAGYHASSGWYILAELVRRLDGRPYDKYVRDAVFAPLGMHDSWVGMPAEAYRAYGRRVGFVHDTSRGDGTRRPSHEGNTEEDAAALRPGANGRGPVRELGKFYQMLLSRGELYFHRMLLPQTIDALTARQRVGAHDLTFRHVIDWGLGFIINSNQYGVETVPYGYGLHASPRTFGHSGNQSSCAFCDPENELVVAWFCNGTPGEAAHARRQREINTAIYADLGLAREG
jgi:CubicO group peptidase (beta-lactamase class C family)